MSNPNEHNHFPAPPVVAGGGGDEHAGRQHQASGRIVAELDQPRFVHVVDFIATVAAAIEVSPARRLIPIEGGQARGPKIYGKILEGGTDFQFIRADGVAELQARYVIQTNSGELIYVENNALRHGSAEAMDKLKRGEPVDPAEIYFRGAVRFETAAADLQWLTKNIFVALGRRFPQHVEIGVFQLL